jgi:hypothetical protein
MAVTNCKICGTNIVEDKNGIRPVDDNFNAELNNIPFRCEYCGSSFINYYPIHDKLMIYQYPPKKTVIEGGLIELPEIWAQENFKNFYGYVLAAGPGFYPKKGSKFKPNQIKKGMFVWFNRDVPFGFRERGFDNKTYPIIICGEQDVWVIDRNKIK